MIKETYTFACPVCAVRLSVPKALAGIRGPCPQCHHDITSPEPEEELAVKVGAMGAMGAVGAARSLADPVGAETAAARQAPPPPPLPGTPAWPTAEDSAPVPPEVPPPQERNASVSPESREQATERPPLSETAWPAREENPRDPLEDAESTWSGEAPQPPEEIRPSDLGDVTAPAPRRRSRWRLAVMGVGVLGLLGLAAMNFFPPQTLRTWVRQLVPAAAWERVMGPQQTEQPPTTGPTPVTFDDLTGAPTIEPDDAPTPIEIRPAGSEVPSLEAPPSLAEPGAGAAPSRETDATAGGSTPAPTETNAHGLGTRETGQFPRPVRTPGSDGTPLLLPDISGAAAPSDITKIDESQAAAREALTLFLEARTWKDRMLLSEGGETLAAEMEGYYRTSSDGPHSPTSMEFLTSAPLPDGGGTVQVFHVTFTDLPQGFPVPVRQTADGWKIDWQAFVEFRESRLKKFLAEYQDAPAVFRVRLQRSDYNDRSVPNLDQKYAFRIAAPIDGHEGHVFVDQQDSIVVPKLQDQLIASAAPSLVMVKLKWVRGANSRGHVELRDIVSDSWRPAP